MSLHAVQWCAGLEMKWDTDIGLQQVLWHIDLEEWSSILLLLTSRCWGLLTDVTSQGLPKQNTTDVSELMWRAGSAEELLFIYEVLQQFFSVNCIEFLFREIVKGFIQEVFSFF